MEKKKISLSSGDRILIYSDGIVEAVNPLGECFGLDRLKNAIASRQKQAISEITRGIINDVQGFTDEAKILDDMTLIGVSLNL